MDKQTESLFIQFLLSGGGEILVLAIWLLFFLGYAQRKNPGVAFTAFPAGRGLSDQAREAWQEILGAKWILAVPIALGLIVLGQNAINYQLIKSDFPFPPAGSESVTAPAFAESIRQFGNFLLKALPEAFSAPMSVWHPPIANYLLLLVPWPLAYFFRDAGKKAPSSPSGQTRLWRTAVMISLVITPILVVFFHFIVALSSLNLNGYIFLLAMPAVLIAIALAQIAILSYWLALVSQRLPPADTDTGNSPHYEEGLMDSAVPQAFRIFPAILSLELILGGFSLDDYFSTVLGILSSPRHASPDYIYLIESFISSPWFKVISQGLTLVAVWLLFPLPFIVLRHGAGVREGILLTVKTWMTRSGRLFLLGLVLSGIALAGNLIFVLGTTLQWPSPAPYYLPGWGDLITTLISPAFLAFGLVLTIKAFNSGALDLPEGGGSSDQDDGHDEEEGVK